MLEERNEEAMLMFVCFLVYQEYSSRSRLAVFLTISHCIAPLRAQSQVTFNADILETEMQDESKGVEGAVESIGDVKNGDLDGLVSMIIALGTDR